MTTPHYNADLYPGMIADYKFVDDGEVNIRMWEWFNENMSGPFLMKYSSTAHWYSHIQISDEQDEKKLVAEFKVELCTETIRGSGTYPQGRLPHSVALDRCKMQPIYYGDNCANVPSFVERHAIPVTHVFQRLHTMRMESDRYNSMREQSYLWEHVVESDLRLTIPFDGDRAKAIEWCEKNCSGSFKSHVVPPHARFRATDKKKNLPKCVFFFEEARDATLFKTFCA